jgi:hypothetical protein
LYLSKEEHTQWSFYAPQLPEALNRHFNSLGMIAYVDGKFYRVILDEVNGSLNSGDFTQEIKDAAKLGLAGLVVSSDQGKMQIISA